MSLILFALHAEYHFFVFYSFIDKTFTLTESDLPESDLPSTCSDGQTCPKLRQLDWFHPEKVVMVPFLAVGIFTTCTEVVMWFIFLSINSICKHTTVFNVDFVFTSCHMLTSLFFQVLHNRYKCQKIYTTQVLTRFKRKGKVGITYQCL